LGDRNHPRKSVNSSCILCPATGGWTRIRTEQVTMRQVD
jgi:hypothetical protein